ncbi:type III-B CRISPR module RAMP protein Cmr6 [Laceyella tengchongensis]|uniref:type III-B CRISPR module RAMP protein Cmr6 n=1 Tax=Laceyella tengchongensis TaxID=574699 RepID=UPI0012B719E1|nr:type III-B CRISPR module RAMP protein Cmr6 [Laceyella tengchongensis]
MSSSDNVMFLYCDEERNLQTCPRQAHVGLWYEKFSNRWTKKNGKWKLKKQAWIQTVTRNKVGDREQINEAIKRLQCLVEQLNGRVLYMKTTERFVTGLGRSHPVENGFVWHATLGTAFLPGSSVKGVVRAWAEQWAETVDSDSINRIFGCEEKGNHHVGNMIFFDAIPVTPVQLEMEIMTPHYAGYYENPLKPVQDRNKPNPIPYLTVASNQTFLFSFAPRGQAQADDVQLVEKWLIEALEWVGAGAKTAVGYGRFTKDEQKQQIYLTWREEKRREEEKRAALASMSPIKREMMEDGYDHQQLERFMAAMTDKWLPRLEDSNESPFVKVEIAEHLRDWYLMYRPNSWSKPNKKNKPKVELIKQILSLT